MNTVGILDYGAGNLKNVCHAVKFMGHEPLLVSSQTCLLHIDKLIIPGVGAFKTAMTKLHQLNLINAINKFAGQGNKILGICLGMQLLFEKSCEFGESEGLGLIPGSVVPIPLTGKEGQHHKIPHIGWNSLKFNKTSFMYEAIQKSSYVYFAHSFMAMPSEKNSIIAHCDYESIDIPSIVVQDNLFGFQFHPEKSGIVGLSILKKFMELT